MKTKAITEGAVFVAIYTVIVLFTKYLFVTVDSLVYYVAPLPIAIYAARNEIKLSIITFLATIALAFIFGNPIYVLVLHIPNLIVGLAFGLFEKTRTRNILQLLITFILCFIANILSVYLFEQVTKIGYFDDVVTTVANLFKSLNTTIITNLVTGIMYAVLVFDAFIKALLLTMLFDILVKRLGLLPKREKRQIQVKYHPAIGVAYIIMSFIFAYFTVKNFTLDPTAIEKIMFIVSSCILAIASLYLLMQLSFFLAMNLKNKKSYVILTIAAIICFPISLMFTVVINFIFKKRIIINQ